MESLASFLGQAIFLGLESFLEDENGTRKYWRLQGLIF